MFYEKVNHLNVYSERGPLASLRFMDFCTNGYGSSVLNIISSVTSSREPMAQFATYSTATINAMYGMYRHHLSYHLADNNLIIFVVLEFFF